MNDTSAKPWWRVAANGRVRIPTSHRQRGAFVATVLPISGDASAARNDLYKVRGRLWNLAGVRA